MKRLFCVMGLALITSNAMSAIKYEGAYYPSSYPYQQNDKWEKDSTFDPATVWVEHNDPLVQQDVLCYDTTADAKKYALFVRKFSNPLLENTDSIELEAKIKVEKTTPTNTSAVSIQNEGIDYIANLHIEKTIDGKGLFLTLADADLYSATNKTLVYTLSESSSPVSGDPNNYHIYRLITKKDSATNKVLATVLIDGVVVLNNVILGTNPKQGGTAHIPRQWIYFGDPTGYGGAKACFANVNYKVISNSTNTLSASTCSQSELDAAKQSGIEQCKNNPSNYNLFTQTQIDAARQSGIDLVKSTPSNYGLFTQTQIDTAKQAGIDLVKTKPNDYNLFSATDVSTKEATAKQVGVQEGINKCKTDPVSCGIVVSNDQCKTNPASCNLFTQTQIDSAKQIALQDGINKCKLDPASCGIMVSNDQCKTNPSSCGLVTRTQCDSEIQTAISKCPTTNPIHATYNPLNGEVHIPFIDVPNGIGFVQTFDVYLLQRNGSFTFDLDVSRIALIH